MTSEGPTGRDVEYDQYRIAISGRLDARWSAWFDGVALTHGADGTTLLTGRLDQAALYGIIAKLRNLGLTLISVAREPRETNSQM